MIGNAVADNKTKKRSHPEETTSSELVSVTYEEPHITIMETKLEPIAFVPTKTASTTKPPETTAKTTEKQTAKPTEKQTQQTTEKQTEQPTQEETELPTPATTEPKEEQEEYESSGALYSPRYFKQMGVIYWNGWRWTWYSERVLPGTGLHIPGRYTDEQGYVRDIDGYICLASDDLSNGTVINTPFGHYGKVYDCGCGSGTVDVYVGW